ncbi:MAG: prolyl oligopeptidase family serine peptidase [Actinomycetota bacterium]|nr:prolyl oligopeptidase family serine peptidase [Actinomycetota bacterium]
MGAAQISQLVGLGGFDAFGDGVEAEGRGEGHHRSDDGAVRSLGAEAGDMALRCLAVAPDVFCAAVAGAPVTSWELYESLYTENYLGRPQVDPATHSASSVLSQVERLRGRVLIVHGLIDGNVHFRHSARLIDPLLAAGVDHEVLLLPEERHHVREEANRQMVERCILAFLCRCTRAAARLIATAAGMTGPTAGCGEARRRR